jgi:hypothetical protein
MYYVIIELTHYKMRVYYLFICIYFEFKIYLIRIRIGATSASHSYSTISLFEFLSILNMKRYMGSDMDPIRFHS